MFFDILQSIFTLILIIIGFYLAFGKSYFSEKGKNLATKEDIGLITQEVETIKNNITQSFLVKSDFIKERKEIGITFFETTSFFIDYSSKVIDILANNSDKPDLILKQIEDIRFQGAKVISTFLKLHLYFSADSFINSASNFYDVTVKIQHLTIKMLFQLEQKTLIENLQKKMIENGNIAVKGELLTIAKEKKEIMEDYIKERKDLINIELQNARGAYIVELSKVLKIED